jgi:soluble lytic murein transglycosylase-like protein
MQVMGQVARENGFTGPYLTRLCNPEVGLDVGCKVLRRKIDASGGDLQKGLLRYNGGGNPDYADEVRARITKYQE